MKRALLLFAVACCSPTSRAQVDAALDAILSPVNNSFSCSTLVEAKVVIRNAGTVNLNALAIGYGFGGAAPISYYWSGVLAPGGRDTVTLTSYSLAPGSQQFTAYTALPNFGPDANRLNDTLRSQVSVLASGPASVPLAEGFGGAGFPPAGWTLLNPNPNSPTWTRSQTVGYNSFGSVFKDNFTVADAGQVDHLVTPALVFSDTTRGYRLSFMRAYAPYPSTNFIDSLQIWVSTDCGGSWTNVYGKSSAQLATVPAQGWSYTPALPSDWVRDSVDLTSFAGNSEVRVRFTNVSGFGNNLFLDDINVTGVARQPLAAFAVLTDTVCVGDTVRVDNFSRYAASYNWNLPGATPGSSTVAEPAFVYTTPGIKTIALTAINGGGTSQDVHDVYVRPGPAPVIYQYALQLSSPVPYPTYQWFRNGQPIAGATMQIYYALQEGVYTLEVTSPTTGCRGRSNPISITNLAVSNLQLQQAVTVAPNPAHGTVTIREALPGLGEAGVSLLNAVGQTVRTGNTSGGVLQLDLSGMAAGVYTLRVEKTGALVNTKLVVQ